MQFVYFYSTSIWTYGSQIFFENPFSVTVFSFWDGSCNDGVLSIEQFFSVWWCRLLPITGHSYGYLLPPQLCEFSHGLVGGAGGSIYTWLRSLWLRYIDDIFSIWKGDIESANTFVKRLNDNDYNLFFTEHISRHRFEFLDVDILIENQSVRTRLFRKSTAGNSIFNASSSHPHKLIYSIPYGELLCARHNCSTEKNYQTEKAIMSQRFKERGYSRKTISDACKKVDKVAVFSCYILSNNPKTLRIWDLSPLTQDKRRAFTKVWGNTGMFYWLIEICIHFLKANHKLHFKETCH